MIVHIDIDSFFASVEISLRPEIVNRPVIVAHPEGMVLAANYLAKSKGVRTTDLASKAVKLLNNPIQFNVRYQAYSGASINFFETLNHILQNKEFQINIGSIDECFLKFDHELSTIELNTLREDIYRLTALPVSIGAGSSKLIAKQASKKAKPFGVLVIESEQEESFLKSYDLGELWGIGPKTEVKLNEHGITSVEQLLNSTKKKAGGVDLTSLKNHLSSDVLEESSSKSISIERSFKKGFESSSELKRVFKELINTLALRVRNTKLGLKNIEINITSLDGSVSKWRHKESAPTSNINHLAYYLNQGFEKLSKESNPKEVFKITLQVSGLEEASNYELINDYPLFEIEPPEFAFDDLLYYGFPVYHVLYGDGIVVQIHSEGYLIKFPDRARLIVDLNSLLYSL